MPVANFRNVAIIARREYVSRIQTKGFWIGTVLLPLLMVAMTLLPTLLLSRAKSSLRLTLVDQTGKLAAPLQDRLLHGKPDDGQDQTKTVGDVAASSSKNPGMLSTFQITIEPPAADAAAQRASLDRRALAKELDAWVWIGADTLSTNKVEYHGESVSNFVTQERMTRAFTDVVRDIRLKDAGYDNVLVAKLSQPIEIETVKVTKDGGKAETGMAGFFFAYGMFFLQYMLLMLYGQQVMSGVLEEKTSRIVEVIVSTVKPFEMMLGKLVGICLVGLTQVLIWLFSAALLTGGLGVVLATLPFAVPAVSPMLIANFAGFFVLGFFVYASFYAALGAAFNDLREAQQAASSAAFFLVVPVFLMFVIINDPDSPLAVATSLFPPFTPLLMLLRIAVKTPPAWQIALGYVLTTLFVVMMTWMCGKIYRVGILMYGKKPTFKELARWIKYA